MKFLDQSQNQSNIKSKSIVFDSSTLITLSQTCLIDVIRFLSSKAKGEFIIPPAVRHETVVHPLHSRRYSLSALRIQQLISDESLKVIDPIGLQTKTQQLLKIANNLLLVKGKPIQLIQEGETQCLAIACLSDASAFAVDEKTTRLLLEAPSVLLEKTAIEFNHQVSFNQKNLRAWNAIIPRIPIMRSCELISLAGKMGYFKKYADFENQAIQSSIASSRNAGCSLTEQELIEYENL